MADADRAPLLVPRFGFALTTRGTSVPADILTTCDCLC